MRKTLLLVFIHGFKGDDDTFANFPDRLRAAVARSLPAVKVATVVYPKYETRGGLKECVGRFREWLQNKVIDLEVANRTASPTVDPSVHVFLVGHSMGGIVAAETLLLLASEQPIPSKTYSDVSSSHASAGSEADSKTAGSSRLVEPGSFMFPHIQGVLAFDTPFLGIAPGVVSYGAEGHYKNVTTAYNTISEVAGLFGFGGASNPSSKGSNATQQTQPKPLPSSPASTPASATDAAATPSWQRWGRYAMFAGAAGAMAAGGAAAMYSQRQRLTDGWDWVSSHLIFVGCLARPSELRQRLALLSNVHKERGICCTNFYTCLGKGAPSLVESNTNQGKTSFSQRIIRSKHRTFCTLPAEVEAGQGTPKFPESGFSWVRAINDRAADEVRAHISMFLSNQNPAYLELVADACRFVVESIDKGWYSTATGPIDEVDDIPPQAGNSNTPLNTDSGFMDADDVVVVD
ncbi:esterase/lipase family protein [Aspergillus thermomutatus]|uniref:DUF676 domain-containing protein n=1 Tax=Aspergillus thermomutatus TaxID=41047 RepID=A0A397H106_ASPTH|nr:uncharacterized protein CDV56_108008 [Aspergillus thermomutatus]RHZ55336.1 hypothetical protein CDV56_108008 [Aspergillus thermomutatus]